MKENAERGRAEDKRTWFKDEANRARLRQVIELVLTNGKIRINGMGDVEEIKKIMESVPISV